MLGHSRVLGHSQTLRCLSTQHSGAREHWGCSRALGCLRSTTTRFSGSIALGALAFRRWVLGRSGEECSGSTVTLGVRGAMLGNKCAGEGAQGVTLGTGARDGHSVVELECSGRLGKLVLGKRQRKSVLESSHDSAVDCYGKAISWL